MRENEDLSAFDSNKVKAILRFKHQVASKQPRSLTMVLQDGQMSSERVNEFGEKEVLKIKQFQRHLSEEEINLIIEKYQAGKSTYALAGELGCLRATITRALKEHGVTVDNRKAMKRLDEEQVVSLYATMHTTGEIAKQFRVHPQTVIRCLRLHGVKIRSRWDYVER